uniref:Uncharacterized protein n=1 Tax=Nelumbo nucifera TaxID=4432 RepID=A0A822YJ99_NELNU|nr:TPA_asm: hypothetical protein HUJ06_009847 [Nelumbo nucifera]
MKDMTTEILVLVNKETEAGEDLDPDVVHVGPKRGCCFWIPCFSSQRPTRGKGSLWWERIRTADRKDRWWLKGWRKVRVSGPRWKAFIRRFKRAMAEVEVLGLGNSTTTP